MSKLYKAMIHVSVYLHELEETGEVGKSIGLRAIKEMGINNFIIHVGPNHKDVCAQKVQDIIEKIKEINETNNM